MLRAKILKKNKSVRNTKSNLKDQFCQLVFYSKGSVWPGRYENTCNCNQMTEIDEASFN